MAAILVSRVAPAAFEFEIPVNQPILDGYLVGLTTTVEIHGVPGWIQNLEVTLDIMNDLRLKMRPDTGAHPKGTLDRDKKRPSSHD